MISCKLHHHSIGSTTPVAKNFDWRGYDYPQAEGGGSPDNDFGVCNSHSWQVPATSTSKNLEEDAWINLIVCPLSKQAHFAKLSLITSTPCSLHTLQHTLATKDSAWFTSPNTSDYRENSPKLTTQWKDIIVPFGDTHFRTQLRRPDPIPVQSPTPGRLLADGLPLCSSTNLKGFNP